MNIKKKIGNEFQFTVDVNLMYAEPKLDAVTTLKRWNSEGKIKLVEAEPPRGYGWSGNTGSARERSVTGRNNRSTDGLSFKNASALLFPGRDPSRLRMNEVNDVVHLIKHYQSKNEIFVTGNLREFIEGGRRERLLASYGIVAMTPDETVETLSKLQGWK